MMNRLSRAEVEVQPYAFTTKALYVGHFDYNYLPWQIIDTPGILDKPLEERNTIEMLSITALAHLNAAVVYVMDVSQQCGYSIQQQAELFENIRPLFSNKPLCIMLNKCDILKPEDLPEAEKAILDKLANPTDFEVTNIPVHFTSTVTGDGLMDLRNSICDNLLSKRVDEKLRSRSGTGKTDLLDRLHVAVPKKRDEVNRPAFIPAGVAPKKKIVPRDKDHLGPIPKTQFVVRMNPKKTERDIEIEQGDDYYLELQKHWDLANPEHQFDKIPEILNGKNISDYIDPEIDAKIAALMLEEDERIKSGFYELDNEEEDLETQELRKLGQHIRKVKNTHIHMARRERKIQGAQIDRRAKNPGNAMKLKSKMEKLGLDLGHWEKAKDGMDDGNDGSDINAIKRGRSLVNRKRARSKSIGTLMDGEKQELEKRSASRPGPRDKSGMRDVHQVKKSKVMGKKSLVPLSMSKVRARQGESDRHIPDFKPKHLFSGKRGMGKTDRR